MKFKKTIFSTLALLSLQGISTATIAANQIQTVKADDNQVIYYDQSGDFYVNYPGYAIAVYTAPAESPKPTGQTLKHGTVWKVTKQAVVNGKFYYEVGANQWVQAAYMTREKSEVESYSDINATRYVNYPNGKIAVYTAPALSPKPTGQYLDHRTAWKVYRQAVTTDGKVYYEVGVGQWVQGAYMSATQPAAPVVQSAGRTMVATAYDPRVLGNTTLGYDTVAANLSVFPRGTRLAITFADGTTKNYVVRDTGGFAYSNPNQLDIAMPNSQAIQFGRQNITVSVLY